MSNPPSNFPTALDTDANLKTVVDQNGLGDDVIALHHNIVKNAIKAIEEKLGIDGSTITTTIDYLLKNAGSVDPGHTHTGTGVHTLDSDTHTDVAAITEAEGQLLAYLSGTWNALDRGNEHEALIATATSISWQEIEKLANTGLGNVTLFEDQTTATERFLYIYAPNSINALFIQHNTVDGIINTSLGDIKLHNLGVGSVTLFENQTTSTARFLDIYQPNASNYLRLGYVAGWALGIQAVGAKTLVFYSAVDQNIAFYPGSGQVQMVANKTDTDFILQMMPKGTATKATIALKNAEGWGDYGRLVFQIDGATAKIYSEVIGAGPEPNQLQVDINGVIKLSSIGRGDVSLFEDQVTATQRYLKVFAPNSTKYLQLYHNATNAIIEPSAGELILRTAIGSMRLTPAGSSTIIYPRSGDTQSILWLHPSGTEDKSVVRLTNASSEADYGYFSIVLDGAIAQMTIGSTGTGSAPTDLQMDVNTSFLTGHTLGFALGTTINEISIDGTLVDNSDDAVSTEKAVKTYVDGLDAVCIHDNVASEISAITEKTSPVGADMVLIEDSEASNAKKMVQITNLPGGADPDAIHDNVADEIHQITLKGTPVGADEIVIEDSEASWAKKRATITSLPGVGTHNLDSVTHPDVDTITEAQGMMIMWTAGATNKWQGLPIGSDNQVLRVATDTPAWETFNHADLADTTLTGAYLEDISMFGSANAAWVPCAFGGTKPVGEAKFNYIVENVGGVDHSQGYTLPLPPTKGGLKLYISGIRVGIRDADSTNYVTARYIYGQYYNSTGTIWSSTTDLTTADRHEVTFTAVDCSSYDDVKVSLATVVEAGEALDIAFVTVRCYYDV